jgi:5S rRNA maturation endonuclease (ribonuclease M5)
VLSGEEIRSHHDLVKVVESYDVVLKPKSAHELMGLCPFHKEKTASFSVNPEKQVFFCHGCKASGDVVHFVARMDGIPIGAALVKLTPEHLREKPYRPPVTPPKQSASDQSLAFASKDDKKIEWNLTDTYSYTDEFGVEMFKTAKFVAEVDGKRKKKFAQKHKNEKGVWVYNLDGVRRVLYNLPNVMKSPVVILTEGERDCETINKLGLVATTNPMGAEKWMDSYSDYLVGKDLIILGDNDEPGRNHVKKVLSAVAGKVKTARVCYMPEGKDVTEYKEILMGRGKTEGEFSVALEKIVSESVPMEKGFDLPIYSMEQMEVFYRQAVCRPDDKTFDLGKFLPTLGRRIEPLVGGDLLVVMADTGVGKSAASQIMMRNAKPLKCLGFQIELSKRRTFERLVSIDTGVNMKDLKHIYRSGQRATWTNESMGHVYTVPLSKLTTQRIEQLIIQSELVIGERPAVVVVDYAQLVEGLGKTPYEKISSVAEQLKIIAVATNVIIILISQVGRSEEEQYKELSLHSAKNSGSIEQSATVLLGLYLDREVQGKMYCKVIKDSNSDCAGLIVPCMRKGWQLSEVSTVDVPEDAL